MAEVLVEFQTAMAAPNGRSYMPRACGRLMDAKGRWEGWIEFVPADTSPVLRTSRETVQPNREDIRYWATGLTATYLEGALERALEPPPAVEIAPPPGPPAFDEPAPPTVHVSTSSAPREQPHALLDPFRVYAQGEDVLRQELTALAPFHLRSIIRAHGLIDEDALDLQQMSRAGLADLIVGAVRKRQEKDALRDRP
jgi:hypothetical protein